MLEGFERDNMNHMEPVARRKAGGNEAWEVCAWERVGKDGVIVEGGIPRVLKSGPRKGKKTWRDMPTQKVVVTVAEIDAEHARYEADTGTCGDCFGKGRVFARWSQANGVEMKECGRCKGTGIAPSNVELRGAEPATPAERPSQAQG
jgi:hypothetical protein